MLSYSKPCELHDYYLSKVVLRGGVAEEIAESLSVPRDPVLREPIRREFFGRAAGRQGITLREFTDCKSPKYRGVRKILGA